MRYIRSFFFWSFLVFFIITLGTMLPILSLFVRDKKKLYQRGIRFCSRLLLFLARVKVEIINKENFSLIDPDKGLMIFANHSSFIDSYVLLANLPFLASFTVHAAGFRMPFLRTIYRGAGYVGVGARGVKAFQDISSLYRAFNEKEKIIMYSDIQSDETKVEVNPAIIELSKRFDIPILPVTIEGASQALPLGKPFLGPGKITLSIGKPLEIMQDF